MQHSLQIAVCHSGKPGNFREPQIHYLLSGALSGCLKVSGGLAKCEVLPWKMSSLRAGTSWPWACSIPMPCTVPGIQQVLNKCLLNKQLNLKMLVIIIVINLNQLWKKIKKNKNASHYDYSFVYVTSHISFTFKMVLEKIKRKTTNLIVEGKWRAKKYRCNNLRNKMAELHGCSRLFIDLSHWVAYWGFLSSWHMWPIWDLSRHWLPSLNPNLLT